MLGDTATGGRRGRCASAARLVTQICGRSSGLRGLLATFLFVAIVAAPGGAGGSVRLPSSYGSDEAANPAASPEANSTVRSRAATARLRASAAPTRRLQRARPAPEAGIDLPIGADPVLAPSAAIIGPVPGPFRSFEGIANTLQSPIFGSMKLPPDTTGDIGPNHYVQAVNTTYAVYARDGTLLAGPIPFADHTAPPGITTPGLFAGSVFDPGETPGVLCDDFNRGDPVVLYDELADRWVIGQFAFELHTIGAPAVEVPMPPYKQCVAVSTTPDPTGPWALYEFELSTDESTFPDYPKIGVWQDAYYLSANAFNLPDNGTETATAVGGFAVALERSQMLAGGTARAVAAPGSTSDLRLFGLLPADIDGAAPPALAPGLFLALEDDNFNAGFVDGLRLWSATVDWGAPSLTLTQAAFMPVATVDSALCGGARNCIPQPDTAVGLDPLSGQLLHRLAYRNFGSSQALVTAHVADASGTDHAGMRWYEIRNAGPGWGLAQSSTFAPDANHRWMGSIAMDASGNLGLGYTTSSATLFPSLNYSGRYATDPAGTLTQGEGTLIQGTGSALHPASRWGDYSTMSVDPNDGCTFWYTGAYYPATLQTSWHTRIGTFSLLTDPTPLTGKHKPNAWSSDPTVDVTLTAANAGCGVAGYSTAWSTDPAVPADATIDLSATTTTLKSPTLAEGIGHYLRVRTVDAQGNAGDGAVSGPFLIDQTSPTKQRIDGKSLASFQTARRFALKWSAADKDAGVANYDVRYRQARPKSGFAARKSFKKKATKSRGSFAGRPGSTYCFQVRARDAAGNRSAYSKERCTAVPIDDRNLGGRIEWKPIVRAGAFKRTVLLHNQSGATLVKSGVRARSIALIATRCGRCGEVAVRHRGVLVGTVDLSKKPFGKKMVNRLPGTRKLRKGKLTLTVVSSGRRVVIDAVAVSRVFVPS